MKKSLENLIDQLFSLDVKRPTLKTFFVGVASPV